MKAKKILHEIFPRLHDWSEDRIHRSVAPGPRPTTGWVNICRSCGKWRYREQ